VRIDVMLAHGASAATACYPRPVSAFRTATAISGRVFLALVLAALAAAPAAARRPAKEATPAPRSNRSGVGDGIRRAGAAAQSEYPTPAAVRR